MIVHIKLDNMWKTPVQIKSAIEICWALINRGFLITDDINVTICNLSLLQDRNLSSSLETKLSKSFPMEVSERNEKSFPYVFSPHSYSTKQMRTSLKMDCNGQLPRLSSYRPNSPRMASLSVSLYWHWIIPTPSQFVIIYSKIFLFHGIDFLTSLHEISFKYYLFFLRGEEM